MIHPLIETYRLAVLRGRMTEPDIAAYERAEDNLARALRGVEWQPIETKPPFRTCLEMGEYRDDGGGLWYFCPTHWMPLPAPPAMTRNP